MSDIGITQYFMHWFADTSLCGDPAFSLDVSGSDDTDYITMTNDVITFDLSDLENRDVVVDNYKLLLTLEVKLSYQNYPSNHEISYTFGVKEFDCRP